MSLQFFLHTRVEYLNYQLNFHMIHDTAQYMWQIQGRSPGATPHICGKKAKKWPNIMVMLPQNHCQFILCLEPREGKRVSIRPNSNPPNASFILFVFSLQLAFHDLYSVFHFVNPLTPGAFSQKRFFWTFWRFSGWILAKLTLIWSKRYLQHDSLPFFPQHLVLRHFGSDMRRNQNFEMRK